MLVHPTLDHLRKLNLQGMAQALEIQLQNPEMSNMTFEERIGLMVDHEHNMRENQRLTGRLKQAKLRQQACIEDFDFRRIRGLERSLVATLATSQWVHQRRNILITGKTGVGKSFAACAFAQKACRDGHTVLYQRTSRLFDEIAVARATGAYQTMLSRLARKDVLVLDDFALVPLTLQHRLDLLEILDDRYERKSTVVVSQIPYDQWFSLIGDETFADAIFDRLIHNSYKICLSGTSGREKKFQEDDSI